MDTGRTHGDPQAEPRDGDVFHRALEASLGALRRHKRPAVDVAGLSPREIAQLRDLADLGQGIIDRKQSLMHGVDALRDGFAVFGDNHELIHANRAFRNFFGTVIRADWGVHFETLLKAIVHYGLVDLEGADPAEWMARFTTGADTSELVAVRDGRRLRWTMRYNSIGHLVVLATDMTGEVQRQRALEIANRKAEQAVAAKSGFLAHMSHELRTPMNGVIGMAELLCDSGLDPEQQRYAETIRNSAEALLTIINDILDYSRGRAGDIHLVERSFDLEGIAIEVATLLQPAAREKDLDLRVFFDPLTPTLWLGDVGRVRQILVNLLGNAVKYTRTGWVRLQVLASPAGLHMLVHDSGAGIPDDKADDIFREFSQLHEPGVTGISGSGLGLAITAQLVEAMGGRLWMSSVEGEGSTFGVTLPLPPAPVPAGSVTPRPVLAPMQCGRLGAERILIMQDDRPLARHLQRIYASAGVPAAVCNDQPGLEGRLTEGPPPCVIMVYCNGTPEITMARIASIRALAPEARICMLLPASRSFAATGLVDHLIPLPANLSGLVDPVLRILAGDHDTALPEPAPPPAPSPEAAADAAWEAAATPRAPDRGEARLMRVLVADDNATNRLVVEKMLKSCVIQLLSARDGQEALDIWRAEHPDLILMDVSMPVMDGREATRMIRRIESIENLTRTRIVAVTAAISDADRSLILKSGMDDVVTKPVRRATLLEQIVRFAPPEAVPPYPSANAA